MSDYTPSGNPASGSSGSSSAIRDELALIAAAIASKANSASPTLVTPVLGVAAATSISFGNEPLSYYDEGTFTPAFRTPGSMTFAGRSGKYTRIGRTVFIEMYMAISSKGTWSNAYIDLTALGVPDVAVGYSVILNCFVTKLTTGATIAGLGAKMLGSNLVELFYYRGNSGAAITDLTPSMFDNASEVFVSGCYTTA